jgi:hypothetical protein
MDHRVWHPGSDGSSQKEIYQLNFLHSGRVENRVEHYFIGLLEKIHRPPKYPKTLRLEVVIKVLLGFPFLYKTKFILIFHALEKVAALAPLFRPYGADKGNNRLGQLLALLGKNLHADSNQDHADRYCKWSANKRKNQVFGIILS